MATARRPVDLGAIAALTWLCIAVGITLVFGPELGKRGWMWLGAHHLLCIVGSSHELWRSHKRARAWERQQAQSSDLSGASESR